MIPQKWIDEIWHTSPKEDKIEIKVPPRESLCPLCGSPVSYIGIMLVECSNPYCKNYPKCKEITNTDPDFLNFDDKSNM